MKLNDRTGTLRRIVVFSLVGAIIFAPATLVSVHAAAKARSISAALSVNSGTARVIVGEFPGSTGTSAHTINATVSSCSFSSTLSAKAKSGDSVLKVNTATGLLLGMTAVQTGIPAGAYITAVSGVNISISQPLTADIDKNDLSVAFQGCHQEFFSANNLGSITVTNFSLQQSVSGTVPGGFQIQKCSGSWTEATGACSGAITNILSTTSGTSLITDSGIGLVFQNGGSTDTVRLRAVTTKAGQSTSVTSVVKNASHLRAGIITNS
jgi:hypothetical protein